MERKPELPDKVVGIVLSLAAITLLAVSVFYGPGKAFGHGWYPSACCGGIDCKPVPCDQLVEVDNGYWKYLPGGNLFHPSMVQPSQDRFCHMCVGVNDKRSICLFIQQGV